MKRYFTIPSFLIISFCIFSALINTGCGIYKFSDIGTIPPNIKTVKVNFIENQASYVNPQLSPNLTDRLRQKIVNQTRLTQTNKDDAHYNISGAIKEYSVSTTGITSANGQKQTSVNRLTVTVQITLLNQLDNLEPQEFTVSHSFDFGANQSLQAAEAQLLDEMVRNLTDEIFNRIFSNW